MAITARALAFASRWFDEATVRRTFEPLIADWQREWQEASPSSRARVSVHGLAAFIFAVIVSSPSLAATRAPKTVTNRIAVRMTRFIALVSVVLLSPMLMQLARDGRYGILVLTMLPSTITTAFPFALIGATDAIRRTQPLAANVERALAVRLAIVSMLFMIVFSGFVVPASKQAFRVVQTEGGAPVIRAVRELTTWQLITDPTMAAPQQPFTGGADRAVRIQRELNDRAVLAIVPVFLIWLRWVAIGRGRGKWWSPLPAPLATMSGFAIYITTSYWGFLLEQQLHWAAGAGYWMPIAAFAIWGLTLRYWRPAGSSISTTSE